MNTSLPPTSANDIDDIMSSIRTGVETEATKPPSGSADLLEQAAVQDAAAEAPTLEGDDEVLELTAADLAPATGPLAPEGDPVEAQIEAQNAPAANPTDVLGVPGLSSADEAADEFDKLLAEISAEKQTRAAEVAAVKEALLADIEPLGALPAAAPAAETSPEISTDSSPDPSADPSADFSPNLSPDLAAEPPTAAAAEAQEAAPQPQAGLANEALLAAPLANTSLPPVVDTYHAGMIADAQGATQLTLPAEVLAMALRPMVQDWLHANLAGVVEKLVREEIEKLNE
jgi:cell pole-organizing protein PopZ